MEKQLQISVVIATYNRAETLRQTLKNLAEQSIDPACYEIVISDDGSPDHTQAVVEEAQSMYAMQIINHRFEHHGIVGYTQNRGIEQVNAPLILLIADDIFLAPDALQEHINTHARYPEEHIAVLGQVRQSPDLNQSAFLRTWNPFQFSSFHGITELPYYMFWACHISVKRNFILTNGMFREELGSNKFYTAHEDTEVGYRLHQHGLRILYNEKALGHHYHITTLEAELKRSYGRGVNWHELYSYAPVPELAVRFHVLNRHTLKDHLRALFGPRRQYLFGTDRNFIKVFFMHLARMLAFNRLTVFYFWLPVLNWAEKSTLVEQFMHYQFYRGVLYYYFTLGIKEDSESLAAIIN
jgi:glycosyltransferase involved in cell wall biosynthesis